MLRSDRQIQNLKPAARPYKRWDSDGLHIVVTPKGVRTPNGSKLWRLEYTLRGRRRVLSFGPHPRISLADARQKRDDARRLLSEGRDPFAEVRRQRAAARLSAENTFRAVAEEWLAKIEQEGRAVATLGKARWLLRDLTYRTLADLAVADIGPPEVLSLLKGVEKRGHRETARRLRSTLSRVFRFAIATGRATSDPTEALKGALVAPQVRHRAAILDPKGVGELLRRIDQYEGTATVRFALQLLPHVFTRPGELRLAEWSEFDMRNALWRIPAERTKQRAEHRVPLSRQSADIVKRLKAITGEGRFLFPKAGDPEKTISENAVNGALRNMGYAKHEMTAHGFRAVASTLLNEAALFSPDAIERALGHSERNAVRKAYMRGAFWNERVEIAQAWSDHLDELRTADIL
jgi:integrase